MLFLGIDPGVSGGLAWIDRDGHLVHAVKMPDNPHDLAEVIGERCDQVRWAAVEKVASSPQMGAKSIFTFGEGFGRIQGVLAALGIPMELVRPQGWMKALGIPKHEKGMTDTQKKHRLRLEALRRHPTKKITLAVADAILIAHYCRSTWHTGSLLPTQSESEKTVFQEGRDPAGEEHGAGRGTFSEDHGLIVFPAGR